MGGHGGECKSPVCRWPAAAAVAILLHACAVRPAPLPVAAGFQGRRITVRKLEAAPVNLYDRGAHTLAVVEFEGDNGLELARDLTRSLEKSGAFGVVGPEAMADRLMRLGLSVGWDASASLLRWVHERAAVDVVVVGRLEVFEISGRDKSADTLTLVETGEYGFIANEEGKLEYREKTEFQEVPLYCRTDIGTVAASYRLWDARLGELVATVRHDLTTSVPSFCYRGDVPKRVEQAARERLLRRLFSDLNEQFLADIVPHTMRAEMVFQSLPGTAGGVLVQSNELAILYASRNQWQLAVEMWSDCLRDRPDLAPVHYNLGLAHEAVGRFTQARRHLEQALALDPRETLYQSALRRVSGSGGG